MMMVIVKLLPAKSSAAALANCQGKFTEIEDDLVACPVSGDRHDPGCASSCVIQIG
jgi:hypothetical protein